MTIQPPKPFCVRREQDKLMLVFMDHVMEPPHTMDAHDKLDDMAEALNWAYALGWTQHEQTTRTESCT